MISKGAAEMESRTSTWLVGSGPKALNFFFGTSFFNAFDAFSEHFKVMKDIEQGECGPPFRDIGSYSPGRSVGSMRSLKKILY